eukprot:c28666_g1_i1 orf=312-1991(-)
MGMVMDDWLSGYTAEQHDESDAEVFQNGCSGSPARAWPDVYANAVKGNRQLENGSVDHCEANVEDLVQAVKVLLHGLGEDVNRDGILKTPLRVARYFIFATKGYHQVVEDVIGGAVFPEAGLEGCIGSGGGLGGMIVVRNIDLFSLCQGCLLPFKVCCHVAYISAGQFVVGLSKLSRVADMFARRLQTPQKLAEDISQVLADTIKPLGVAVVVQCWHPHLPGICDHEDVSNVSSEWRFDWKPIFSCAGKGLFEDRGCDAWHEFMGILCLDGIALDRLNLVDYIDTTDGSWCHCLLDDGHTDDACPGQSLVYEIICNNSSGNKTHGDALSQRSGVNPTESETSVTTMIAAVESILHAICGYLNREELKLTSKRFVKWLLNFDHRITGVSNVNIMEGGKTMGANGYNVRLHLNTELGIGLTKLEADNDGVLLDFSVPFCSQCEHHLLPFYGIVHVGWFAMNLERSIERSAVQKIVQTFSRRLQVQERLTKQIAEEFTCCYGIQSVMVVSEASHLCMVARGVEKLSSSTATVAVTGRFVTDISAKVAVLQKISNQRVKLNWT